MRPMRHTYDPKGATVPIYQTLDAGQYDPALFVTADSIRVGEAYARLLAFYRDETATLDVFSCDSGTYSAVKRAAARIAGIEKDRSTTVRYVQRTANGRKVWKRLAKSATVKQNDTIREGIIRSYSSEAMRKGIETLRESGCSIEKRAENTADDVIVVALVRSNTPDATEQ